MSGDVGEMGGGWGLRWIGCFILYSGEEAASTVCGANIRALVGPVLNVQYSALYLGTVDDAVAAANAT